VKAARVAEKDRDMKVELFTGNDVKKLRPLWEACFPEETKIFTDYYFENKAGSNITPVQTEQGEVFSMIHLTPYRTNKGDSVCYVVGVGTQESHRRRGLMDGLLREAFRYMKKQGEPFTFLMPAKPEIYTPYGFTYIYDKTLYEFNEDSLSPRLLKEACDRKECLNLSGNESGNLTFRIVKDADCVRIADFANSFLASRFDCFMKRSESYYHIMIKELAAQNGGLFTMEKEGKLLGLLSFTYEEEKAGIQEGLFEEELVPWDLFHENGKKSIIMARILDVKKMLSVLESEKEFKITLKVTDEIIRNNEGVYGVYCGPSGSHVTVNPEKCGFRECREAFETCCEVNVQDLTAFLFGYKKAAECFKVCEASKEADVWKKLDSLKKYDRVFINEIV